MEFSRAIIVVAAVALAGCEFTDDSLWPSLTGEEPAAAAKAPPAPAPEVAQAPARPGTTPQPPLGTTEFKPARITPGAPTGTYVGKKVVELRGELKRMQDSISKNNTQLQQLRGKMVEDSQRYHGTVAAVNARLQVGTTPGNPILVQQFNSSQADLDRLGADIGEMNKLATAIAGDSTLSAFLSESVSASYNLSGAVDEDHVQLAILEDEVNRTVVLIDRLLKEVTDDVRRQTSYVSTERSNLNLMSAGIKSGEIYGASLVNRAMVAAAGPGLAAGPPVARDTTGRRPLVVIRFDRVTVPYQQALYNAVSRVLERRPNAVFDLVAVAPAAGGKARVALNTTKSRRHADTVRRSLVEMGLPPGRLAISSKTSLQARTNEVHVYLR
ncbi:MAG: hypothetical protein IIC04_02485 [Proteobacteria bacterium]|nr:hypothetical protein [Pseudomonadota bacterium]